MWPCRQTPVLNGRVHSALRHRNDTLEDFTVSSRQRRELGVGHLQDRSDGLQLILKWVSVTKKHSRVGMFCSGPPCGRWSRMDQRGTPRCNAPSVQLSSANSARNANTKPLLRSASAPILLLPWAVHLSKNCKARFSPAGSGARILQPNFARTIKTHTARIRINRWRWAKLHRHNAPSVRLHFRNRSNGIASSM